MTENTPTVSPTATPTTAPSTAEPSPYHAVVGLGLGKDYAATTATAIAYAGGLDKMISAGSTVLIKPNLCWSSITSRPVTTDYRVVAEIVRQAKELGAGRIIIAEGPFGPECFTKAMLESEQQQKKSFCRNLGKGLRVTSPYLLVGIVLTALFDQYFPPGLIGRLFSSNKGLGVLLATSILTGLLADWLWTL